jgi:hypothetical protein
LGRHFKRPIIDERGIDVRAEGLAARNGHGEKEQSKAGEFCGVHKDFEFCIRPLITGARQKVHFFGEYFEKG